MDLKLKKILKETIRMIPHRFGFHKWEVFGDNFRGDDDTIATIGWKQCRGCGKWKLLFFYGSGKRK